MENGGRRSRTEWRFRPDERLEAAGNLTIRGILEAVMSNIDDGDSRAMIPMGHGDPSVFPCFRITPVAVDAVISSLTSAKYNSYSPTVGILPARRAVADYLSSGLPYKLSPDDVFLTIGCTQAIEVVLSVLARPQANVLLPRPGFPFYEAFAASRSLEVRHYNLIPDQNWQVDLDSVESLADENTVAIVIINPGNPCGNVFTYQHLAKVAETARKLGILVISDEVYAHLAFGSNPFVPMGTFGSVVPILTLGSISKRWIVPGWRFGWLVTSDPNGVLKETKIFDSIKSFLNISSDPTTFIQAAVPEILNNTNGDFFKKIIEILRLAADICYNKLEEVECITCPHKPDGSMFVMVKLDLSILDDMRDDLDFCCKLAKEEKIVILPGSAVGLEGWLRITFAIEPSSLEEGLERLKSFCQRHRKKH